MVPPTGVMQELSEDVLAGATSFCNARAALELSSSCRAMLVTVEASALSLFAAFFGSRDAPGYLKRSRPRLLSLLDRARDGEASSVLHVFGWASGHGFASFLERAAAEWRGPSAELLDHMGKDTGTALCRAARACGLDAVRSLLALRAEVDLGDQSGRTPLFWAARRGDAAVVGHLLDAGAAPLRQSRRGDCPLGAVVQTAQAPTPGQLSCIRLMAERLEASERSSPAARQVLLRACEIGAATLVAELLSVGISAAAAGPAHAATATPLAQEAAESRERAAAAPDAAPPAGTAASHAAAWRTRAGHAAGDEVDVGIAPLLSTVGSAMRVTARSPSLGAGGVNGAALQAATHGGRRPASASRLQRADRRAGGTSASARNVSAAVEARPAGEEIPAAPPAFPTPLLAATAGGFGGLAVLLLERDEHARATLNTALESGKTALHLAAEQGDAQLCSALLGAGADLDLTTCSGRSVLHTAVERSHAKVVAQLSEHAEVRHLLQSTPGGASPVALAERRCRPALLLPLLQCYQRHVRRGYPSDDQRKSQDERAVRYLAATCAKHGVHLVRDGGARMGGEPDGPDTSDGASSGSVVGKERLAVPERADAAQCRGRTAPAGKERLAERERGEVSQCLRPAAPCAGAARTAARARSRTAAPGVAAGGCGPPRAPRQDADHARRASRPSASRRPSAKAGGPALAPKPRPASAGAARGLPRLASRSHSAIAAASAAATVVSSLAETSPAAWRPPPSWAAWASEREAAATSMDDDMEGVIDEYLWGKAPGASAVDGLVTHRMSGSPIPSEAGMYSDSEDNSEA